MTSLAARQTQLQSRLSQLKARLHGIETELGTHQSRDWEDMATEREEDEVLEGMGNAGLQEMRMIEAALARIAAGEYGFCMTCGTAISDERLDVLPYTPFCRNCAP